MMASTRQSYFPLVPLKSHLKNVSSSSLDRLSRDGSDPLWHLAAPDEDECPLGSQPSEPISSARLKLSQRGPPTSQPHLWHVTKSPPQMALLPLVAIGYLVFCYTVHGKAVPVSTFGLYDVTQQHFATIKGGITSISIIIISIALYPIHNVVSNLRSEEFFRVLASRSQGVQLGTINYISTLSFGHIDMLMAIWNHMCSNYYILAITASLLIWVVATLAPGALTVDVVLADGELMAFIVGAVPAQSVLNGTDPLGPAYNSSANSVTAASIAWAEMELGVQYSFGIASTSEPDYAAYIAPVPLDLSTTTSARWLSDVIGINPTCSWASTNLTSPVQLPFNSSSAIGQSIATAYLLGFNLDVQISGADLPGYSTAFATVKDPTSAVTNHTTHVPPSDGSTVFLLGQCQFGCSGVLSNITLDMTGITTAFTISFTDQTWNLAILACLPNMTIETREIRNNGHGILTVQPPPAGSQLKRQGNLNPVQTNAMFSIATMSLTQGGGSLSGSRSVLYDLGSQVQGDLLFGQLQFENLPGNDGSMPPSVTVTLASIEDITKGYTQIIQSVAKSYLGGYLGTAYVPGRISTSEIVFAASIPNLVISSVVFVLLFVLILFTHFRREKGMEFTLVNLAAAVHGSELPAQVVQMSALTKLTGGSGMYGYGGDAESAMAEELGATDGLLGKAKKGRHHASGDHSDIAELWSQRRVFLQRRVDGSPVLHLSP